MQTPRFAEQVSAYEAGDRENPPPEGCIVCTGSSIMRGWMTVAEDMAPMPVINRAFGGSQTWEVLHYMDRIVMPYKPRVILYYCGSNDLGNDRSGQDTFEGFAEFVRRVHLDLPKTLILYMSINRVVPKQRVWHELDKANDLVRDLCEGDDRLIFIDVNPCLFDEAGNMREGYFGEDQVHLWPPAYRAFAECVRPILEGAWARVNPPAP